MCEVTTPKFSSALLSFLFTCYDADLPHYTFDPHGTMVNVSVIRT